MEGISAKRWGRFLAGMKFEDRLEFNEGDVGLPGAPAVDSGHSRTYRTRSRIL